MEDRPHTPKSHESMKDDMAVMKSDGADLLLLTCPCGHREVVFADPEE